MERSKSSNEDMSDQGDFEINDEAQKQQKSELRIVLPGDYIGKGFIAGHGTYEN
jgi:hypothetical protein